MDDDGQLDTEDKQIKYLAELEGYKYFEVYTHNMLANTTYYTAKYNPNKTTIVGQVHKLPDYFNNLNDIHRLAHKLEQSKQKELRAILWKICGQMFAHLATAKQMANAILLIHDQEI